jgi:hypothetical protein
MGISRISDFINMQATTREEFNEFILLLVTRKFIVSRSWLTANGYIRLTAS